MDVHSIYNDFMHSFGRAACSVEVQVADHKEPRESPQSNAVAMNGLAAPCWGGQSPRATALPPRRLRALSILFGVLSELR